MTSTRHQAFTCAVALLACSLLLSGVSAQENNPYMGAPVTLVEAPNGAIANKRILDGGEKVGWHKPTIEQSRVQRDYDHRQTARRIFFA